MTRAPVRDLAHAVVIVCAFTITLAAQVVPAGADSLSQSAVSESLAVLKTLDGVVRANRNDGAAWYRMGMVAWALTIRADAKPAVRGLDPIKLAHMADTSLRIAVQVSPKNARYQLSAGTFLRYENNVASRLAAWGFIDAAATAARDEPDSAIRATIAIEVGRLHWLRYDDQAHVRHYLYVFAPGHPEQKNASCPNPMARAIDDRVGESTFNEQRADYPVVRAGDALSALRILHNDLAGCTQSLPDNGVADYEKAEALFREALWIVPADSRAFRHLAMLLEDKNRWRELETVSRDRTIQTPSDPNAWLALGLALHRGGKRDDAGAVFDTALARLSVRERGRLFDFARLLTRKDSTSYKQASAELRERTEKSFWAMADPLWSRPGDEPRTEFLARVTYAEIRWTVDEMGLRGADSNRGEIYIRYGPPDSIAVLRGSDFQGGAQSQGGSAFATGGPAAVPSGNGVSDVITYWDYDNGLFVVFMGQPSYGTARFPVADQVHIEAIEQARPTSFDNIELGRIDEIPIRAARFRTTSDSIDVVVLTQAPVTTIHAGSAANAPVRTDAWLFGRDVPDARHDSLTLETSGLHAWTYRVRPSAYMYRVEATADGAQNAGRGTMWIAATNDSVTGFTTRGFGMSDLLLTSRTQARVTPALRWRDFNIAPILGDVPKQGSVDFLWENYEFGQRDGQSRYQITVTVQRQRSAAGRIAAEIVGAVAGSVGVNRTNDRITLQFEHSAPYAPAFVDHITVGLGETPSGTYRATLEILDRVTGRKTSRSAPITIRE